MRVEVRGGNHRAGTACLFLLPFDIIHKAAGSPREVSYRGKSLRMYPPFCNESEEGLLHEQVRLEAVPHLPNTVPPHVGAPRLENIRAQDSFAKDGVRANALRLDLLSSAGADDAVAYVNRFLELARMLSLQWWITRDRRFDQAYIRNSFEINSLGERVSGVATQLVVSGRPGVERVITRPLFDGIVDAAANDKLAPLSVLSLCDAFYFFTIADMRRFVVEAAIACELVLTEHAYHNAVLLGTSPGEIKRELDRPKFAYRIDAGCTNVYGRSFAREHPLEAGWLEALWIGRNNAAHGKEVVVRHGGRTVIPQSADYLAISNAVVTLFSWMVAFGPFKPV